MLLAEDMLIGTSTKIVNGQPKNATKNFSIGDLTGFIKQNVSLNDVLLVDNASLLDAKIGKLYLYDTPVADYGNISLNQNRFSFNTVTHSEVFRAQRDMFSSFSYSGYRGSFEVSNITANRVWDFPNKSGTVALLSDVPSSSIITALPFTTDHISATGNQYIIGDVVYYNGNIYRCIASNDSLLPTNPLYWTNLGVGFPIVQQPADWNATSGNNQILNKPSIPPPPTLQEVTDEGNETTNNIIVTDNSENKTQLTDRGIRFYDLDESGDTWLKFINTTAAAQEIEIRGLGGTMALLSDITTPTLQEVTDEGNTTTNSIIIEDNESLVGFEIKGLELIGNDLSSNAPTFKLGYDGQMAAYDPARVQFIQSLLFDTTGDTLQNYEFPNKPTGTYTIATTDDIPSGGVTSVGLTMPSAFTVTNSPITSSGDIAVTGAGTVNQYVRGDGTLANFPNSTGGGSSVNYYLNGSVSQGTFGGTTYYQMSKTPVLGAGTNFTRTNGQGNGYIASFITDAGDPSQLNIPGGNWNLEFYFNASSGGGSPSFYAELYKVSDTGVFTLIASDSLNPEGITNGTNVDQYYTSIPVPQTSLLVTDRLAVRIFVNTGGRTITLHTENGNLSEVLTTFTTGLTALNGLTDQVQFFDVGTGATNFNISSSGDTHTFNLLFNIRRNANNSSNNNINYNGYAVTGSAESSAVWTITRLTIAASGSITVATATNVAWTDRETTIYT
jgi:hypothetical protein